MRITKTRETLLSLVHCQSPLAPTGGLTLGSRLIYAKVAYKVVACMSALIGNYYTKTNPRAILPNSVQKSLGKPGYMCRVINYTMEQTPAVGRHSADVRCSWLLAPVGSQIPSASAHRRGLLCPWQCFRMEGPARHPSTVPGECSTDPSTS